MALRDGRIFHVPLEVATTPIEGHAYVNRWWSVHPEKGVAFYVRERPAYLRTEEPSPQCNTDRAVVEHVQGRVSEGHEARFLPVVYAAHAITYVRHEAQLTELQRAQARITSLERLRDKLAECNELARSMGFDGTMDALLALQAMKRGPRSLPTGDRGA